jgi:hypothetical protein
VIFETERTLLEQKDENDILKREIGYLTNSKNDMERAYRAVLEEKKMMDRELMTLRSQIGSVNNSVLTNKHGNFTNTLNPGDYIKNRYLPSNNYEYPGTQMGNPHDTSSFVSAGMAGTYNNNFYNRDTREMCREENTEDYESEAEGEDQIIEQSYESESNYGPNEEMSIHDKLKQVKEAFNSIKSSIHGKIN